MPTTKHAQYVQRMRELPPTAELAAKLRAGQALKDVAKELGTESRGLANHLIAAGFMVTGESEKDYRRRLLRERLASSLLRYAEPWMVEGICAQTDPESFFPEKGESTKAAKRVCMGCPVRGACLEFALQRNERFGVWGAKSERERRAIAKQRAA